MSRASVSPEKEKDGARFEFDDDQKDAFRALAASMSFVGVCLMLFGVLLGVFAIGAVYSGFALNGGIIVAVAAAYAPAAWWTMSAGRSLSGLVRTRGGDMTFLMEAVGQMRLLFGFARAVIIVQALLISALAGIFVWCTFLADKAGRCWSGWG
jgi:hypothetical protein